MKNTAVTFKESKLRNEKLTMLTAYDYSTAKIIDEAGIKWNISRRFSWYGMSRT